MVAGTARPFGVGRFCSLVAEKPSRVGSPNPAKNFGLAG
nr:MAG TPA: hypothetical protein [Caudoviricetes sp.]